MSKPSGTNYPNDFLYKTFSHPLSQWIPKTMYRSLSQVRFGTTVGWRYIRDLGGNSSGVPPLPIPNREVKPVHADGTAVTCGRVGSRLLRVLRVIGGLFFMRQKGWIKGPSVTDTTCPFLKVTRITGASSRSNEKWFEDRSVVRNPGLAGFQ